MDDLLKRAYNAGAQARHTRNSLAHLMFTLSASLQESSADTCDAPFPSLRSYVETAYAHDVIVGADMLPSLASAVPPDRCI